MIRNIKRAYNLALSRFAIRWWRKRKICVFCNDGATFTYKDVPVCNACLALLGVWAKEALNAD